MRYFKINNNINVKDNLTGIITNKIGIEEILECINYVKMEYYKTNYKKKN